VPIDATGVTRLKAALELGKAPVDMYRNLMLGRATEPIPGPGLAEPLRMIAKRPRGLDIAVDVLSMRFHGDGDLKREHHPELVHVGRDLLLLTVFDHKDDRRDCELGSIARACLHSQEGASTARALCVRLKDAVSGHQTSTCYHDNLLGSLFQVQPKASLDGLLSGDADEISRGFHALDDLDDARNKQWAFPLLGVKFPKRRPRND
jgi:hypothetical protein